MRFNRLNHLVRHAFRRYQRRLVSLQAAKGGYVRESSFSQFSQGRKNMKLQLAVDTAGFDFLCQTFKNQCHHAPA